jgi:Tol biopolymer transport system component
MKRCPECRRDYTDETLNFCLDDGTALLEGPASGSSEGPSTAVLHTTDSPSEAATRAQISTTDPTAIYNDPSLHSGDHLTGGRKRRTFTILLATFAAIVIGGGGFAVYKWTNSSRAPFAMKAPKITRLTSSGRVVQAAISPNGRYVAYIQTGDADRQSIWMRQVAAASDAQIVPEEDGVLYGGLTFSPDGEFVYYVRMNQGNGTLWRTPILGGGARKLNLERVQSQLISLSPDGKQVAFDRVNQERDEQSIVIANLDGSGERTVTSRKNPFFNGPGPVWSPDGRTLLIGDEVGSAARSIVSIRIDDGSYDSFSERVWEGNRAVWLAWLNDGSGVLVTAAEEAGTNAQIWFLGVGDKEGQQITSDLSQYTSLSLTGNSATICAVRTETTVNLWVADVSDIDNPRQITSGSERNDGERGLTWSPDGRVYFYSDAGGGQNIWVTGADGSGTKQVTTPARRNRDADISPDGRYIVWESNRGEGNAIWRMDIDGGNPKQLTTGGPHYYPKFSPDGKWIVFSLGPAGAEGNSLSRVSVEGGGATPIQGTGGRGRGQFGFSRDGTRIFFPKAGQDAEAPRLVIIPFEGGEPVASIEIPQRSSRFALSPDGRSVTYVRQVDGQDNIWSQPLDGGPPKQLTHYKSLEIRSFAWSRDGKKIVMARGNSARDVVLIKDFR